MKLGRGLEGQGGRSNPSILADAMEAILGAVFLDGGYEASRDVIANLSESDPAVPPTEHDRDAKSLLQELLQARGDKPPAYRLTSRTGPDHAAIFEVEATMSDGSVLSTGRGSSIKTAEFAAARYALRLLRQKE
jgi:ribonuclease-3